MYSAFWFHAYSPSHVVEGGSGWQRKLPSRRVRDAVQVVGVATGVRDVLQLGPKRRVEGEHVLICLQDGVHLASVFNKGRRTYLDEAESRDLGLDEEPADGRVGDPDAL